ncbi:MAG: hypothetical protein ACLQLT_08350 [Methylovirgula sp.]
MSGKSGFTLLIADRGMRQLLTTKQDFLIGKRGRSPRGKSGIFHRLEPIWRQERATPPGVPGELLLPQDQLAAGDFDLA